MTLYIAMNTADSSSFLQNVIQLKTSRPKGGAQSFSRVSFSLLGCRHFV